MLFIGLIFAVTGQTPSGPSGHEIILRMEHTYANLRSYEDTGEFETTDLGFLTGEKHQIHLRFKTEFKAPGKLYFRFQDGRMLGILCARGQRGKAKIDPELVGYMKPDDRIQWLAETFFKGENALRKGEKDRNSLELEIWSFTGVSFGTSYNVPTMIFPETFGRRFDEMQDAAIVGSETLEGEECYVVKSQKERRTLWIGENSSALYRILKRIDGEPDRVTTYHPTLNPAIKDSAFKLDPTSEMLLEPHIDVAESTGLADPRGVDDLVSQSPHFQ
jgi:hypothetical protein